MNATKLLADSLAANAEMLKMSLADFSDQDMLQRPAPGANHAAWQLGHMINSETRMIQAIKPGAMPELPPGFSERFTPETAKKDDLASFGTKQQLLDLFSKTRQASVRFFQSLSDKDLDQPTPERMRSYIPNVGALGILLGGHLAMHLGQMQVTRRKLGKPILF
jgi:hypothetical protein